jgi:arsenical pump membrane protein
MPEGLALALAVLALVVALAAAIAQSPRLPEAAAAGIGAVVLVAAGALSFRDARHALGDLAPTVGFLAALLVLAEGCRRDGLFAYLGGAMARRAGERPRRLLALVFVAAAAVTAVLSLDATVVLLTPVVFATAARLQTSPRPHVYACSHLANSSSLLLPVSNLTNLLAFHASDVSFARFAGLMALPTLGAIGVEWLVLSRFFAVDLRRPHPAAQPEPPVEESRPPRFALAVLAATLGGFAVSSTLGVAPVWFAVAGAAAITAPALRARATGPRELLVAAEPGFLVFVLGLGVIVEAAADNGLADAVRAALPAGDGLPDLLAIAGFAALLANAVNNLPATLMVVPVAAAAGPVPVLAALIGVNVGPNLTYAGSLATLLWRRVLRARDADAELGAFLRLGVRTVPASLAVSTVLLWLAARV